MSSQDRLNLIKDVYQMKLTLTSAIVAVSMSLSFPVVAGQGEFCDGFEEGYKSLKGDMVIMPICPIAPITPVGSKDFREGLKLGIREAQR